MFYESCKEPYRNIDKVHHELCGFEEILEGLRKSCGLFDIQLPDEKNLKQCRREVKLAKVILARKPLCYSLMIYLYCLAILCFLYHFNSNCGITITWWWVLLSSGKNPHGRRLMLMAWTRSVSGSPRICASWTKKWEHSELKSKWNWNHTFHLDHRSLTR